MKMPVALGKAIKFASMVHAEDVDKSGRPYLLHTIYVMQGVLPLGDDYGILGMCHDTIEDNWADDLQLGFDEFKAKVTDDAGILTDLDLLTHRKNVPYMEYIRSISQSERATAVKLKDLEHNSQITRLKGITDKDMARMRKYNAAYLFLTGQHDKLLQTFE